MVECDHGDTIHLIARIENEAGLKNVDGILVEADGIMLCRGSLSCEMGPEKLALMQKLVAAKAQAAGKASATTARQEYVVVKVLQLVLLCCAVLCCAEVDIQAVQQIAVRELAVMHKQLTAKHRL